MHAAKSVRELITLSARPNEEFRAALVEALGEENIVKGTAVLGEGPDFVFALESREAPVLYVDGESAGRMRPVRGTPLWFATARLETGRSHSFYYVVAGERRGGRTDIAAYLPESYEQEGVPHGTLSEKLTHTSQIYPGMTSDYWIYVPAQYRPDTPAALMVWQDGESHTVRNGNNRTLNVVDNLIQQDKIPVMILVFINPGTAGGRRMRSIEYDRIDDTYARFLRDELLPEVYAKYNIRKDGYSRAIAGVSSGGICAFNVAWNQPDQFSRVLSIVGSFTSIQWRPGEQDGGNLYPFKVRKEDVRNIRVWLQDGSEDLENNHGSWPLQNIQMANSLKLKGYDFHFSFGHNTHSALGAYSELPRSMAWLWRDYDPSRTEQIYEADPQEADKPFFRVKELNR